jgi:hypothetical protein
MRCSLGKCLSVATLLASTALLSGCIHSTTVYDDVDVVHKTNTTNTIKQSGSSTTKVVVQHQFYYYPSMQVYRDCESNRWHWCEGGVWKSNTKLPKSYMVDHEVPYVVVLEGHEPQHHHAVIVKNYPAKRMDSRMHENHEPRKSLPSHANGVARGHDKQNDRAHEGSTSQQTQTTTTTTVTEVRVETSGAQSTHASKDHGRGNDKGKDKDDDDKGKSSDKKDKAKDDKGKGKGKDKDKDKD